MPGPSYTVPTYSFSKLLANADKKKKPAVVPGAATPPATPAAGATPAPAPATEGDKPVAAVQTDCDDVSDGAIMMIGEDESILDTDAIMSETEATSEDLADGDGIEELSQ